MRLRDFECVPVVVGDGVGVRLEVECPCPPFRNNIVTLCHLFPSKRKSLHIIAEVTISLFTMISFYRSFLSAIVYVGKGHHGRYCNAMKCNCRWLDHFKEAMKIADREVTRED